MILRRVGLAVSGETAPACFCARTLAAPVHPAFSQSSIGGLFMADTPNRSSTTTQNTSSSQQSPRPTPAGVRPTTTTTVRPAGGPNGNAGRRPPGVAPRPGGPGGPRPGPGGRPGGPGAGQRPGNGRPGGGGRPGQRGGPHGSRNGAHAPSNGAPRNAAPVKPSGPVEIPAQLAVKDLAELLNVSVNEVIRQLIAQGVFA